MNRLIIFFLLTLNLSAADFSAKLEQVANGQLKSARVEWWGTDQNDATEILQKAIDSKAEKIIIGKSGSPWLTRPLKLRSNLEIVIEDGAVLKAKSGEFKQVNDCLLNAVSCKNIIIRGPGSLLMNKKDYQDTGRYKHSEWRHAIALYGCENIKILNLTIMSSGGDGVYINGLPNGLNYSKNIVIKNCIIDDNHRQGISVISAENLLVSSCRINNTSGTAPMAGIDFEPNSGSQRLVNCVVENCSFENNSNYGVLAYIKINDKSKPVSITVKDCTIKNSRYGIQIGKPIPQHKIDNPAQGLIKFVNCHIENTEYCGIKLRDFYSTGFKASFEDCKLVNTAKQSAYAPLLLDVSAGTVQNTGNTEFINTVIDDSQKRPLVCMINLSNKVVAEKISGTVIYNGKKVNMADYIIENKLDKPNTSVVAKVNLAGLLLWNGNKLKSSNKSGTSLIIRKKAAYLLSVKKGEKVNFDLLYEAISKRYKTPPIEVKLVSPSGKEEILGQALCGNTRNKYSFDARESGVYAVYCNPKLHKLTLKKSSVPYSILLPEDDYLNMFKPNGRVYFGIPAGVSKFNIEIVGQGGEKVDAAIFIGNKKVAEEKNINVPRTFEISCKPLPKTHCGSIVFSRAKEDVQLRLPLPLLPVIAANESELIITNESPTP